MRKRIINMTINVTKKQRFIMSNFAIDCKLISSSINITKKMPVFIEYGLRSRNYDCIVDFSLATCNQFLYI